MKQFNAPTLTIVDGYALEPVYASSGTTPGDGGGETPKGDWDIKTQWENHNTGSHSELKIIAHNYSQSSGDNLSMDFFITGFKLDTITPGDQCLSVLNQTENSFTMKRLGRHFNPNENIEFVIQLTGHDSKDVAKDKGAVGVTGSPCSCTVVCTGYSIS